MLRDARREIPLNKNCVGGIIIDFLEQGRYILCFDTRT